MKLNERLQSTMYMVNTKLLLPYFLSSTMYGGLQLNL